MNDDLQQFLDSLEDSEMVEWDLLVGHGVKEQRAQRMIQAARLSNEV